MTRLSLCLFALTLTLSACGSTPHIYDLSAVAPGRMIRGTLTLESARTEPPFDGDMIVIRTADGLERLGGAQWADNLSRLAWSRVTQSLENAGWRVGESGAARLRIAIRRFEIDAVRREALVEVSAQFTVGGASTSRLFSASAPVAEISGAEPPMALDHAFSRVLGEMSHWTVSPR